MATEFTVWRVEETVDRGLLPFKGLDNATLVFTERHPGSEFYDYMGYLRDIENTKDDYVLARDIAKLNGVCSINGSISNLIEFSGYKYVCDIT